MITERIGGWSHWASLWGSGGRGSQGDGSANLDWGTVVWVSGTASRVTTVGFENNERFRIEITYHNEHSKYLNSGEGDLGLPMDSDWEADWVVWLWWLDNGRSWSKSFLPGLGGPLLESWSSSPTISGEELWLISSILSEESGGPLPLSRFLCSSLSRSAFRHLARRFWNQTLISQTGE